MFGSARVLESVLGGFCVYMGLSSGFFGWLGFSCFVGLNGCPGLAFFLIVGDGLSTAVCLVLTGIVGILFCFSF